MKSLTLIAALFFAPIANADDCYSEGVRVGVVQKFSSKGLIDKSWEGELVMDGIKFDAKNNRNSGGNVWKFSTLDKEVAKAIDDAAMIGSSVALRYCEISPLDLTRKALVDTPYIVTRAVLRK